MAIAASELILNPDGSIYHLNIKPEQMADTIITVGDPDRVDKVTEFFDTIEFKQRKREFHTQTGSYKGKRITVVSTGIGTDNIDIVFNELDALANINLKNREIKPDFKQLSFVRIGTSGSLHENIPVDSFLISEAAIGFDSLWYYYEHPKEAYPEVIEALIKNLALAPGKSRPYYVSANADLVQKLSSTKTYTGITATNVGFYAPQGRYLRAKPQDTELVDKMAAFNFAGKRITNMEMETSGIYAMASILGHKALSMNAMIANRATGQFSANPKKVTHDLIAYVLEQLVA